MLSLEFFLAALALAGVAVGAVRATGNAPQRFGRAACLLLVAADGFALLPNPSRTGIAWKTWSPQAVEQARKEGHPALVDFTAKTCLTCIANKASSLEKEQTRAKLREIGAVSFEADFTDEDPVIARELVRWRGWPACRWCWSIPKT